MCIPISKVLSLEATWQGPLDALASQSILWGQSRYGGEVRTWCGELSEGNLQDKEQAQRNNGCEQSERFIHPAVVPELGLSCISTPPQTNCSLGASTVSTCKFLWLVLKREASHSVNVTADIPIYNAIEDKPNPCTPTRHLHFFPYQSRQYVQTRGLATDFYPLE